MSSCKCNKRVLVAAVAAASPVYSLQGKVDKRTVVAQSEQHEIEAATKTTEKETGKIATNTASKTASKTSTKAEFLTRLTRAPSEDPNHPINKKIACATWLKTKSRKLKEVELNWVDVEVFAGDTHQVSLVSHSERMKITGPSVKKVAGAFPDEFEANCAMIHAFHQVIKKVNEKQKEEKNSAMSSGGFCGVVATAFLVLFF